MGFDLTSKQPELVISNLSSPTVHRLSGVVCAWSGQWKNYRIDTVGGPVLVCSGDDLGSAFLSHDPTAGPAAAPPIVLEAASWINHTVRPEQKLRVTVTARAFDRANAISAEIARQLGILTIGNPTRIQAVAQAETDSPPSGTVRIEAVN